MTGSPNPASLFETAQRFFDAAYWASLLKSDIVGNSLRLILTRWVAGIMVLAATAVCIHILMLPLPASQLYIIGVVILIYNIPLTWSVLRIRELDEPEREVRIRRLVTIQVVLDWVSMSFFVHLTGGISSPAIPFFLIHMLMVTILLPGQSPYIYLASGIGALGLVAVLEQTGILPHYTVIPGLPSSLHTNLLYIAAQMVFISTAAFATVYLVSNIVSRLRIRERQIATLLQTSQAVSSTLSLQEVMDRLAHNAAGALSMPGASIRLLDESGRQLRMAASYGLSRSYMDKGVVDLSRSRVDQEALEGHWVIIDDVTADLRLQYPQQVLEEGIRSMMVAPIIGQSGALGILRVYSHQPGAFDDEEAAFVMAIAQQGASALENALAHDALRKADQERAEFVRIVTHELRSPVTGAQSLLRTLIRGMAGDLSETQQDILSRIERRLDVLINLINDLLDLAASKTTMIKEVVEPLPLQPVVRQVIETLSTQADEKHIDVQYDAPDEELIVTAGPDGLARIFENLIGNAIKYTPNGGSVRVTVEKASAGVIITIADTGIGIPQDDLPNLWNEFFRARNARESQIMGTGLGLSIVKRLVERYKGTISVCSDEGKGTEFSVRLPANHPAEPHKHEE
ncbi:MAG: GAF domain-containing sensor histidine kinase [Anaerolineae bacterium]|nr:GAF domain-containing sensor histidine kinase [Anaerolineae bacterium]